jgi:hypothetical protein
VGLKRRCKGGDKIKFTINGHNVTLLVNDTDDNFCDLEFVAPPEVRIRHFKGGKPFFVGADEVPPVVPGDVQDVPDSECA